MLNDGVVKSLIMNIIEDEENFPIVEALSKGVETDEEIAEKTGIKLNVVRKILYRLYDLGLASYKRSKDPETQWFTYTWKFEPAEINKRVTKDSLTAINYYSDLLEEEENNMFFVCPEGHVRLDFNTAQYWEFLCPDCGEKLEFQDNSNIIAEYKEIIKNCKETYEKFSKNNE